MKARRLHLWFFAFVVFLGFTSLRAAAESENLPAVERCQAFCGRVFGPGSDELEECAEACSEADACNQRCKAKFGEDQAKMRSCVHVCMSRHGNEPPEPEPDVPNDNPPVQL